LPFSAEEINRIIDLKNQKDGSQLNVFNLNGSLILFNSYEDDLFNRFSSGSLPIDVDDFWACQTEDDVLDTFRELLKEIVLEKLL
jgi:hypothetical protein